VQSLLVVDLLYAPAYVLLRFLERLVVLQKQTSSTFTVRKKLSALAAF
jgi:hypothetical protein